MHHVNASFSFQSTPPVKAATTMDIYDLTPHKISIHAAREGGDSCCSTDVPEASIFQSTPPVKAATISVGFVASWDVFQSTPPVKAATASTVADKTGLPISIHAAREGGDCNSFGHNRSNNRISIHAAREGGDPAVSARCRCYRYFNPRRP